MNNKNNHWNEIIDMVKVNMKKLFPDSETLDVKRAADLQNNVFSHIDSQFPVELDKVSEQAHKPQVTPTFGALLNGLRDRLTLSPLSAGMPAMAIVAVAMISIGLLMNNNNEYSNPYFDVPEVFTTAGLDSYIQPVSNGSRAIATEVSDRKTAFYTGMIQAEIDLAGVSHEIVSANIIASYPDLFEGNEIPSRETLLEKFNSHVVLTNSVDRHSQWFEEGYKVEMTLLSARSALATFNTDALQEAILYFKQQTDIQQSGSTDVNPGYFAKRQLLSELAEAATKNAQVLGSPDTLQQVIDLTKALKVLVH